MRRLLLVTGTVVLLMLVTVGTAVAVPPEYPFFQNLTNEQGDSWSSPQGSYDVAVNASGYIHVSQPLDDTIEIFNPSFQHCDTWMLKSAYTMAFNSTGYLFVVDNLDRKVRVLDPSGTVVNSTFFDHEHAQPNSVAVNRSGFVFVTVSSDNDVRVFDRNLAPVPRFDSRVTSPIEITVNSQDQVFIASGPPSPILSVLDRDNQFERSFGTGFTNIWGLATDTAGNVLVSGSIDTEGDFRVFSPTGFLVGTSSGMPMTAPMGLAMSSTGKVVIINNGNRRVHVFGTPTPTPTPSGSASFAAYPQSGPAPHTVQFLDYTQNGKEWQWDFGDGSTSALQYPIHVYNRTGLYTVSLAVTDWAGQTSTKTEYHCIRVTEPVTPAPTPVANFSANTTTGSAPLAVQFTDTSSPAPYHQWWQFGDGATSTDANPVHVYERTGAYTVNLTVWTSLGQATVSKPAYVTVDGDPRAPVANFTLSRTSGQAPLYVKFTDASTGNPTSWRWDFGGFAWTTMRNPSVVFRQPGEYPVTLTVRNAYGWSSMSTNVTVTGAARSAGGRAVSVVG